MATRRVEEIGPAEELVGGVEGAEARAGRGDPRRRIAGDVADVGHDLLFDVARRRAPGGGACSGTGTLRFIHAWRLMLSIENTRTWPARIAGSIAFIRKKRSFSR